MASVGIILLGMTHPILDNILGAGQAPVAALIWSHESEENLLVAL